MSTMFRTMAATDANFNACMDASCAIEEAAQVAAEIWAFIFMMDNA